MIGKRIISLGLLSGLLLFTKSPTSAQQPVPCLIFTGNAQNERSLDLALRNRVYIGSEGMTIGSSENDQTESVNLAYSDFHRFKIGMAVPEIVTTIYAINTQGASRLVYHPERKAIRLVSDSEHCFAVGIYDVSGKNIATSTIYADQYLNVDVLSAGMYIATASDGETQIVIKFIIK